MTSQGYTAALAAQLADVPAQVQTGMTSQGYTAALAAQLEEIADPAGLLTVGKFLSLKD